MALKTKAPWLEKPCHVGNVPVKMHHFLIALIL